MMRALTTHRAPRGRTWLARRAALRGQGGYMLASVLGMLVMIALILGALFTMTGTALRVSETFRDAAEVDRAADSAMDEVLNYLRRNDTDATCSGANTSETPHYYDESTFDDANLENVVPLEAFQASSTRSIQVKVTCQIVAVQGASRYGVLEAFVDGVPNRAGRASFQIVDQANSTEPSRVVISEWQVGSVTDSIVGEGPPTLQIEYLVVGGGGAGGAFTGGGGGGGGVVTNLAGLPLGVTSGDFQVTVGAGGVGGEYAGPNSDNPTLPQAANGQDSIFNGIVAKGGGGGGSNKQPGAAGGSGGGGGHDKSGGIGAALQGNDGGGGTALAGVYGGGGGGGAGAIGGLGQSDKGGNGGGGQSLSISGTARVYGGGGGGGAFGGSLVAAGGVGGGGSGGYGGPGAPVAPTNGAANTGGGGGGQRYNVNTTGGSGGSGVVVIRYPGPQKANGGTVTSVGGYTIHTFTTVGAATFTVLPQVEYLVVGGGGAGGGFTGGGGGGGGVLTNEGSPIGIAEGNYTVVVGAGAPGFQPDAGNNDNPAIPTAPSGGDSQFSTFIAKGGGGGGSNNFNGANGGSGGGGGHNSTPGGAGTTGQGFKGGGSTVYSGVYGAGGGGGATVAGQAGSDSKGGNGGAGLVSSLTGSPVAYGGGGGGGATNQVAPTNLPAPGGAGGGGNGGLDLAGVPVPPTSGAPNTGGGGGGQRRNINSTGGAGGSGIVVIRYTGAPRAVGGTITRSGGYTFHTFATPGTYTISFG